MSDKLKLSASERIASLLDDSSFVEIGAEVNARATDFNEKAEKFASKVQNGIADTQLSELLKSYTTCLKTLATGTKSKIKSYVPLVHSVNNLSLKTKETVYCTAFIIFTESLRKIGFPANLNMIISYIWTLQFLFIFKIS